MTDAERQTMQDQARDSAVQWSFKDNDPKGDHSIFALTHPEFFEEVKL